VDVGVLQWRWKKKMTAFDGGSCIQWQLAEWATTMRWRGKRGRSRHNNGGGWWRLTSEVIGGRQRQETSGGRGQQAACIVGQRRRAAAAKEKERAAAAEPSDNVFCINLAHY
jgi:hypothetical protein